MVGGREGGREGAGPVERKRINELSHPRRDGTIRRAAHIMLHQDLRFLRHCPRPGLLQAPLPSSGWVASRSPCSAGHWSPAGVPFRRRRSAGFRFRADVRCSSDRPFAGDARRPDPSRLGCSPPAGSRRGGPGRPVPAAGRPAGRGSGLPSWTRWAFRLAGAQPEAIDNCHRDHQ